jgi:citrate lyase subunit beta/citryl-CoA lyase
VAPVEHPPVRRRRSCLSVPGSDARKVEKALASDADEVVVDLEDAVAAGAKDDARALVVRILDAQQLREPERIAVRVNAPGTPWCHLDLLAVAGLRRLPGSVVLPKVESAGDLAFVERLLDGALAATGDGRRIGVQALVETARGVAQVAGIAAAGGRLEALVLGYADLAASLGLRAEGDELAGLWLPVQSAVLVAARAAGLQAVDGPHLGVHDDDPFRTAVGRTRALGFDGRWAIHPAQVAALNDLLSPSAAEVAHATAVLAALAEADLGGGAGAVALDGQMLDEAVAAAARRVLASAGVAA